MNKFLLMHVFFFLCISSSPLKGAVSEEEKHALTLFAHISSRATRLEYFFALKNIRLNQELPASFFMLNPDLSHFYFQAKTKRFFEIESNGIGRIKQGLLIKVPIWVEAACRKNWNALHQLLQHSPSIVEEAYNDDPFCKIVFAAAPPESIIQQIIEITATLAPDSNPFLGTEKDPTRIPFSSLHLETPFEAVALCTEASRIATHAVALEHVFCENAARLCARHITANTHSPFITLPETNPWGYAQDVLLQLIKEKKYHGFDNYFAFLVAHHCPPNGFTHLASVGVKHLAQTRSKEGSVDISDAAKRFFSMALRHYPDQTIEARITFITTLIDEYIRDHTIHHADHDAQVVFASMAEHKRNLTLLIDDSADDRSRTNCWP